MQQEVPAAPSSRMAERMIQNRAARVQKVVAVLLFVLSFLLALSSGGAFYLHGVTSSGEFPKGTVLVPQSWALDVTLDVSGLTREEALTGLQQEIDDFLTTQCLALNLGEASLALTPEDLGLMCEVEALVDEAWAAYEGESVFDMGFNALLWARDPKAFVLSWVCDQNYLRQTAQRIAAEHTIPAVDAQLISWTGGEPGISPEQNGSMPDSIAIENALVGYVSAKEFGAPLVVLDKTQTPAALSAEQLQLVVADLSDVTLKKATYATEDWNAMVEAAPILYNVRVEAGQTLDVADYLRQNGAETSACGPLLSAMFQASHNAGLDVVRTTAEAPLPAISAGLEAVLEKPEDILTITNPGLGPIIYTCKMADGVISVEVHGVSPLEPGVTRKLETRVTATANAPKDIVTEDDDTLFEGEEMLVREASKGQTIEVISVTMQGEAELLRSPLATVEYQPLPEMVRVGTKK